MSVPNITDALEEVDISEPRCCAKFENLRDLQRSLSVLTLPSGWVFHDPSQLPDLVVFSKYDANGRVDKSISYTEDLVPRIHICNEPYRPDLYSEQRDVCKHEIQYRVEKVDEMKLCWQTQSGPPARADSHRKACDLIVEEGWGRSACRTCYNSDRSLVWNQNQQYLKTTRSKDDKLLLKLLRRQIKKVKLATQTILDDRNDLLRKQLSEDDNKHWLVNSFDRLTKINKYSPNKFNDQFLEFAIDVHRASPKAYRRLQEHGLVLPSETTIRKYLNLISTDCGIIPEVMYAMAEVRERLNPRDQNVIIGFDEMTIEESLQYCKKTDRMVDTLITDVTRW